MARVVSALFRAIGAGLSFGPRLVLGIWRGATQSVARLLRGVLVIGAALGAWGALIVGFAAWEVLGKLPDEPTALMDGRDRGSVTVLDKDGVFVGVRGQRMQRLTTDDAAPILIDAVLATEDRRFYWHMGVDPIGVLRALWRNWRAERIEQGGSTITQQVAKLAFLDNRRELTRKLRELPLALALEWRFTKDEILSIYLNRAYLGAAAFGFEAAAQRYFGHSARRMTAAESAVLAGLLRAPSRWAPTNDFSSTKERARLVLDAMVDARVLSPTGRQEAERELGAMRARAAPETAPYFVDWIAEQMPDRFWEQASDLVVHSTFDRVAQAGMERGVETQIRELAGADQDAEAAAVILSRDGAVRALMGGRDYSGSQFNRATATRRPLGSAFKPFVYAAAFEAGVRPDDYVLDAPVAIRGWRPKNYAGRYRGEIPLTTALAKSSNVAAVRMIRAAGVRRTIDVARRFGFHGKIPGYPSIALGVHGVSPIEVASAYAVFGRNGVATPAWGVREVRDRQGNLLWRRQPPNPRQAISPRHAEWMTHMLEAVVRQGTGRRAALEEHPVAGKTGTTQDYRDAWFAGFTGSHVGVVWLGRDDFTELRSEMTGGRAPAAIWREMMAPLHGQAQQVVALTGDVAETEGVVDPYAAYFEELQLESEAAAAARAAEAARKRSARLSRLKAKRERSARRLSREEMRKRFDAKAQRRRQRQFGFDD